LRDKQRAIELKNQFVELAGLSSFEDVKGMSVEEVLAVQQ
jgi:hypothetical protein